MVDLVETLLLVRDFFLMTLQSTLAILCEIYKLIVPPPEKNVRDQLALITGAGGSLGRELALQLSNAGARLILTDVNEADLQATGRAVDAIGGEVYLFNCDITKPQNVTEMARKIQLEVGYPSMVFHCAGVYKYKPFLQHTADDVKAIIDVNVLGTIWMSKAFLGSMTASNSGHLVLISSVLGVMGRASLAPYCASKFAITGLADALTQELREEGVTGVKVSIVHPFMVGNISDVSVNIRVPGIFDILSPSEAAKQILTGVRRNQEEIFLPGKLKPLMRINRMLPRQVRNICQKFVEKS